MLNFGGSNRLYRAYSVGTGTYKYVNYAWNVCTVITIIIKSKEPDFSIFKQNKVPQICQDNATKSLYYNLYKFHMYTKKT